MKLEQATQAATASKQQPLSWCQLQVKAGSTDQLAGATSGAWTHQQAGSCVPSTKYHRAAMDGYIDMLCDASRKEANSFSLELGLTPTLLAAQRGHLEALRILVGRGGEPERAGPSGACALHLAAANGHLNCVSFLVNFGANMWALDNDLHTAKDVAAMGQRKEVLDYLDQVMAKQSALNTKSVQKLKEKAKVAAEKRLKLLRKAQLKAIKQVERDERQLVRLSNNRRLLRAAHSISDIKLVGRSPHQYQHQQQFEQPARVPASRSGSVYSSSAASAADSTASSSQGSASNVSSSPSLTGSRCGQQSALSSSSSATSSDANRFLKLHKLQMDLLMLNRARQSQQQLQLLNLGHRKSSSPSVASGSINLSSAASTTGSKGCKQQTAEWRAQNLRPKYSDLVAVNEAEAAARLQLAAAAQERHKRKLSIEMAQQQQQRKACASSSDKSSLGSQQQSSLGSKLWGISGVSRKVQLRRLLATQTHAQSTSDLAATQAQSKESEEDPKANDLASERLKGRSTSRNTDVETTGSSSAAQEPARQTPAPGIKWPQAPSMSRAVSEPDFGAALRQEEAEEDDSSEESDIEPEEMDEELKEDFVEDGSRTKQPAARVDTSESRPICGGGTESQHQLLLTRCLSQLKLRHEAISNRVKEGEEKPEINNNNANSKPADSKPLRPPMAGPLFAGGSHSDELLQHQLSAGEFPLRPSLIKQQQQQISRHQNMEVIRKSQQSGSTKTGASADSIGSASSFAKRNALRLNSSASSSSSSSSAASSCKLSSPAHSFASYSYSAASSGEAQAREAAVDCGRQQQEATAAGSCGEVDRANNQMPAATDQLIGRVLSSTPPPPPSPLPAVGYNEQQDACVLRSGPNDGQITNQITIETFLKSNGLLELSQVFAREKIDLEALILLTEEDLKSLNILLGPRRKLLKAIADWLAKNTLDQQRKGLLTGSAAHTNLKPMYVMVDTHL